MIVRMAKVLVLGPRRRLREALAVLHTQGVVQLRSLAEAGEAPFRETETGVRAVPLTSAEREVERGQADLVRRVEALLILLPAPDRISGEAGASPGVASAAFEERLGELETEVRALSDRRAALQAERDLTARYGRLLTALAPLRPVMLEGARVTTLGILLRRDRPEILRLLEEEVGRLTQGACVLIRRELDREQMGLLLSVPRAEAPEVSRLLFERGIAEIRLPARYEGQPLVDALLLMARRIRELPAEIAEVEARLLDLSRHWHRPLRRARDAARDRLTSLSAMARCGETEHAFVISGWLPAEVGSRVSAALDAALGGRAILVTQPVEPAEYDEAPVALRNPPFVRAFEPLVGFFALPRYGSVDPTPCVAGFFPLFFGLMLGDVGFGALALALALLARVKGWGGGLGRRLATVAAACAFSAIAFGLLFGELFGELGAPLGLHPILFDRRTAALSLLGLALGLGTLHIVLGIALSAWTALGRRHWKDALARATTLGLLLVAAVAAIGRAGYLPPSAGWAAVMAVPPLLVAAVVLEGALAPLEVVRTAGNVLSYARLMALGTASVMLADVANRMAHIFTPAPLGLTLAVSLHAVNFAMGLFSPTIQALRLHYVEFFDKFFEGGGKPYQPFALAAAQGGTQWNAH